MNYLAHIFLSSHNNELLAGNFIADAVKGRPEGRFPQGIVTGIVMHRAIDEFTDKHPATREAVRVFQPQFGRYAPIITDIIYDYLLANNWELFSDEHLPVFATDIYTRLAIYRELFPERMQRFYDAMVQYNFLPNYGEIEGISQTLNRMQMRTASTEDFVQAVDTLQKNQQQLIELFIAFFTDLNNQLQKLGYK